LRYLTQESHISSRELSRILGKDESLGAKILSGERKITVEHAKKLADRFKIKASAFLDL
jgi:antitoxin component HigA of HigAB toxin-antitoxin module